MLLRKYLGIINLSRTKRDSCGSSLAIGGNTFARAMMQRPLTCCAEKSQSAGPPELNRLSRNLKRNFSAVCCGRSEAGHLQQKNNELL